jgi:hypothetical protein
MLEILLILLSWSL